MSPSAPAKFHLGFQLVAGQHQGDPVSYQGNGLSVTAQSRTNGIYGVVRSTETGRPLGRAKIVLSNGATVISTAAGAFAFAAIAPGTYALAVSHPGCSAYQAVNISYQGGGLRIDCQVEPAFDLLKEAGITYEKYDDRAEGSTIMHVVTIPQKKHGLSPGDGGEFRHKCLPLF